LVEQDKALMQRASYTNQARLHTGLHYPRSLLTASESKGNYERFIEVFGESVKHFNQIYAISSQNSKTSADDFRKFLAALNVQPEEVNPRKYFFDGVVEAAFRVEEPTFDTNVLKHLLEKRLMAEKVEVRVGTKLVSSHESDSESIELVFDDGSNVKTTKVILATYASTNNLRSKFRLPALPLSFELTEIIIGEVGTRLANTGITVMDGPFWSLMPFGDSGKVSLTSVGLTPTMRNEGTPTFRCQSFHDTCSENNLENCNSCYLRPKSLAPHQIQQMKKFLKDFDDFKVESSLFTVKTILKSTQVDDARPTFISKEHNEKVVTVFSGKISTIFDLESELE
jgi:hypothetical protein